jgi:lipopolysaccharide export system ATP-binding protein
MDMVLLETKDLFKQYGGRTVVDDVSIVVHEREIVGLLGRNGAGKTTTFRMAIGMVTPQRGQVIFEGRDISKMPMFRRARLGMGYLSQEPSVFQRMSVEQNLLAILETMSLTRHDRLSRAGELIEQFGLTKVRKQQARLLSGGERRKLEIARALVTNPSLILLDEPFSGVDPIAVEDLQKEIHALQQSGISILITDHNVERTLEVVNQAYILNDGKILAYGPPAELIHNKMVRDTYLGNTFAPKEFHRN